MEAFESFEHAGFTVELHYEEDGSPFDPRDVDNLGTMVCWHPDYILGDEQIAGDSDHGTRGAVYRDRNGSAVTLFQTETGRTDFRSMEIIERYLRVARGAVVVLPLQLYDHSGLSMRASSSPHPFDQAGWDTTMCGFIYTTAERCAELCGTAKDGGLYAPDDWNATPEEWLAKQLRAEVDEYSAWLSGEVYFWLVRDEKGEVVDSCGGYVGSDSEQLEHMRSEARAAAEWEKDARAKRAVETVRGWSIAHNLAGAV